MKRRSMAHDARQTRSNSFSNDDKTIIRTKMMDKCNTLSAGGETFCSSIYIAYSFVSYLLSLSIHIYIVYLFILYTHGLIFFIYMPNFCIIKYLLSGTFSSFLSLSILLSNLHITFF